MVLKQRLTAVLVTAVLVVAACGGTTATPSTTQPATGGASAGTGGTTAPTGGTLNVAIFNPVKDINPRGYEFAHVQTGMVFEPLVAYDSSATIVPMLAESWTESPDGLTYAFKLRSGVVFQDGTPFDAEAAKWNFDQWVGTEDHNWLGATNFISTVVATDPSTLTLTLKEPYSGLLQDLAIIRPVRFMSPKAANADGSMIAPIGTGPWKWVSGDDTQTVLERNDDYWGEKPGLDQVVFKAITDSQARQAALQRGEVDLIGGEYIAPIAPEEAKALQTTDGVTVLTAPGSSTLFMAFEFTAGILSDASIRQAISRSIDREGIATALFGGFAAPAASLFPPVVPYAPQDATPTYDPEAAKVLLEQAGWTGSPVRQKGGETLSFDIITSESYLPQSRSLGEAVKAQLAEIGIEVNIRALDQAAYQSAVTNRDFDMYFDITYGSPYDPLSTLRGAFFAGFTSDHQGRAYASPELDTLIDEASKGTTDQARAAAYQKVWDLFDAQAGVAPLVSQSRVWATGSAVSGFQLGATEYDLPLVGVSVTR